MFETKNPNTESERTLVERMSERDALDRFAELCEKFTSEKKPSAKVVNIGEWRMYFLLIERLSGA